MAVAGGHSREEAAGSDGPLRSPRCEAKQGVSHNLRRSRLPTSEQTPRLWQGKRTQNPPPASSQACSSSVLTRPRARLRCGKRPKRSITSRCACAYRS